MSIAGPGGLSPLASSTAGLGAQSRSATANQAQADSSAKAQAAARQTQLQRSTDDVGSSGQTGDRDADGREAWRRTSSSAAASPANSAHPAAPRPTDDDRGQQLDLTA